MRGRAGIFGGTFDPPHIGHLMLASEAYAQLHLTQILWVLTPEPPHKLTQPISALEDRLEMLKLELNGKPAFTVCTIEIDRPGPHYTSDTLRILQEQYPELDLVLLLGGDSLHALPTWHRPASIVAASHQIGVMNRPGIDTELANLEEQLPGLTSKLIFIEAPLLWIAAREIRRRAFAGLPFRNDLLPAVYDYVVEKHLYQKT